MTKPLRLLLWHWGRRGGGPRYTLELAKALSQRPSINLHISLSRQSELFAETDALGLSSRHVDTYTNVTEFIVRSSRLPRLAKMMREFVKANQIDVIYNTMDFLWGSAIAPMVARSGPLYMLAVHDAERHPGEDGPVRRWLLARDIAAADGAITMTDAVRQSLIRRHSFPVERAWTAPLGVFVDTSSTTARSLPSDRPPKILFFGRVLPYKGLDILLAAMPLIRTSHPGTELEIWSSGDISPYRHALQQTEGVRLHHGWMAEDQIPGIFARTDLCVLPYREASQSAVIATAMAAGMPVVTTPIAGPVEQIAGGQAGRVATGFDPEAISEAICGILGDRKAYAAASARAVELSIGQLSWPSIAERIEVASRELLALGPRPN
jgi:glycosyltransferase involved in cell wall biosynthesis